jgi:uncharacterized protein involved in exopolysaccharide biosynthesis
MADLTPKQIEELKKKFAEEVKKSASSKTAVAASLKQSAELKGSAAKMKAANSKEVD